jgi:carbonic anhydrase/acetyltransferase-like protein (isoleucine patch superfamily)
MGATVLSGATIGTGSIIAAGALVPEETEVPPGSVVMGVPGKVVRETTEDDIEYIRNNAQEYVDKVDRFRPMRRLDEGE